MRAAAHSPTVKREPGLPGGAVYYPEPSSATTDRSSTVYRDARDDDLKSEDADGEGRKKRQKRNKPTLSCFECVERKTKVGRPFILLPDVLWPLPVSAQMG